MITISYEDIKQAIELTNSMNEAAVKLNLHFSTFKRKATIYGLYVPNQGLKGSAKPFGDNDTRKFNLWEILEGKYPSYQTFKLKNRMLEEGLIENVCSECNNFEWNGKPLNCELDHINGIRHDHRRDNLRMLCPNCHSQTDTYRSKKRI